MSDPKNINEIEDEIKELKQQKKKMNSQLRLKSKNNSKSNVATRVSISFLKKLDYINEKREEKGFDKLSNPKITELIIKHISSWNKIEQDIINFNTSLDSEEKEEEFKK